MLNYKNSLKNIILTLRKELEMPDIPFIMGDISSEITRWQLFDNPLKLARVMREICGELPNFRVVSVDGLSIKEDGLHFNSKSYRELGKRYFEAMKDIEQSSNKLEKL